MENSPLDLSKPETPNPKPVTKLRNVRPRMPPRPSPDTCVDTIFIRRTGPCGVQAADRSEQRRMGHRIRMTRRKPTQRPTGSSTARQPAGCLARSCHARDASNAPVRAAGTNAGRSSERRPARRATSRRGAHFTPGRGEGPRNRAGWRTGENGNGDRRLGRRDNGGDGGDGGDSVAMRVVRVGRRHQRHPPPVGRPRTGAGMAARYRLTGRPLRSPASSRSDRRPDARRRK